MIPPPLKSDEDAVIASCRFSGQAPIRKFQCKNLDDAPLVIKNVSEFRNIVSQYMCPSKLASEMSGSLDYRDALSVSILRKC